MFKKKNKEKIQTTTISNNIEESKKSKINNSEIETAINTSFFYTNDKFLDSMDSELILSDVLKKYPDLIATNTDTEIKHEFLRVFQDKDFIQSLLT